MNLDQDIKYINISTSSLSYGSALSKSELDFLTDGFTSVNFPFGKSEDDFIKFSVFDFSNTPITSSFIYGGGTYTPYTQSYYDVRNNNVIYSYKTYTSDFPILEGTTSSLFIDIARELRELGINDGNYKISIELLRNMIGSETSSSDKLIIDKISNSRTEIALIPKTLKGTTAKIVDQFDLFSNNQIRLSEVAEQLLNSISSPQFYNIYYSAVKLDPTGSNSLKFNYGFTSRGTEYNSDIDVISFITDLYYGVRKGNLKSNGQYATNDILGIYDQFKNWLYQNYSAGATFQDIKNYYYSLFRYIVDQELNRITNKKPEDYDSIVNFLQIIYYNTIFFPNAYGLEFKHNIDVSGYFKNYINFNNGKSFALINKKSVVSTDPRFYNKLVLKLEEPLPFDISVGDDVWITNTFGFLPIIQNLYYFTKQKIQTFPLRGPNFLIRIENEGNSTEALSMEELINQTGSQYNEVLSKINTKKRGEIDNTNYRYFENFVNFSSANLRMRAYDEKQKQIERLQETISLLDQKLISNPNDPFFTKEREEFSSELDEVEASMDGYEKFLYNNYIWYDIHDASASLYDKNNANSLINNLPQFMVEEYQENQDFIVFVGMIGHFFDNISISVKQFTEKNNYTNSPSYGISLDVVENMLRSLGWDAEISKENLPLLLGSFSKNNFDPSSELYNLSNTISEEQRNQIIWKRILNSLPYIYKTKGTEASLSALFSCFGIPKNIIKIKEYGNIQNIHDEHNESLYVIDEVKYEPYFQGKGEYFRLNWTGSIQSIEFNFAFDPNNTSEEGKVFRLANCPDYWVIGAYRDRGKDWGRLFFSLDDGVGNVRTIMTDRAPIFDGNTYHAVLRRNYPDDLLNLSGSYPQQIDPYPIKYDICLQKADDAHITFNATASLFFSGSYNENYRSGSYVCIGNYNQNTASLNIDPEAFFGNIDEIKLWETPLSDDEFKNHTLHQNSYDLADPKKMISSNIYRISFERPVDLFDISGTASLNNLSFRSDFPTFQAINFPEVLGLIDQPTVCSPASGSVFPYQFLRKDTRQTVKIPDYGASKFRSNKINYLEQDMISNLSSDTRATVRVGESILSDTNKLGIFFSPADIQNTEIIKFFGEYPLSDLIGDPSTVYESSYQRFETFRQMFYDQGFGNIDYQFFMNIVRFYFDKAMFKYIKSIVPARVKLVDGILVEPSILERPKIELKPMVRENIPQRVSSIAIYKDVEGYKLEQKTASLSVRNSGLSILNDINHTFFPTDYNEYGTAIYAENGITYYNDEFYRADVIEVKKSYQVHNKYNLPKSSLDDREINVNLNGTVQTVSRSYYKINLAKLPTLYEYPMTMSFVPSNQVFYFSGSVGFSHSDGYDGGYAITSSHNINGTISGSIYGFDYRNTWIDGNIADVKVNADYFGSSGVTYVGNFVNSGSIVFFEGNITGISPTSTYRANFYVTDRTVSIFTEFKNKTTGPLFGPLGSGINYRKQFSMEYYPYNAKLLNGYSPDHYKYGKTQFSVKEITSYDQNNKQFKWKKGSQNKKTTVNAETGLLDNSDPVETKTL